MMWCTLHSGGSSVHFMTGTLNKQEGAHLECFHLLRLLLGEALLGHEVCGAAQDIHARAAPKLEHVPNSAQNTTASSAPSIGFSIVCLGTELEHAKGQVPWLALKNPTSLYMHGMCVSQETGWTSLLDVSQGCT